MIKGITTNMRHDKISRITTKPFYTSGTYLRQAETECCTQNLIFLNTEIRNDVVKGQRNAV